MTTFRSKLRNRILWCVFWLSPLVGWGAAQEAREKVVLQLPFTHQFQFAGVYAAQTQGYFREEGLDMEVRQNTYGLLPLREMKNGRAQYGVDQSLRVLRSRLEGEPVVVLTVIFQHSPYALAVKRGSGIHNPQDLLGKRVALESNFRSFELSKMLTLEGLDASKVTIVPNRWDVNELQTGEADAMGVFATDSPYDLKLEGCEVQLIRPSDYGVDFYGDCLVTTEHELQNHPQRAAAVRRAVLRGWDYALKHPEEVMAWILTDLPGLPKRVTRERLRFEAPEIARLVNPELIELGSTNPGRWRATMDMMIAAGVKLDPGRLHGLLYQPEESRPFPLWGRWLLGGLALLLLISIVMLLANRRLQQLVDRRTLQLRESQRRQREIFDLAPTPITIEDYTDCLAALEALRRAGVPDLREHLRRHPEAVRELHQRKRIVDANRLTLQRTGYKTVAELNALFREIMNEQAYANCAEEMVALWEGRDQLALETHYQLRDGEVRHTLLNWQVSRKDGTRDLANVQLVFTDITEVRRAEQAKHEIEQRYGALFDLSPVALVEFDYHPLEQWFVTLRDEGVRDFAAHVSAHPGLRRQLLELMRITAANRSAFEQAAVKSVEELQSRLGQIFTPQALEERIRICQALWDGLDSWEGTITLCRGDGQLRVFRYKWRLTNSPGLPGLRRSLTALVDVTVQHAAEQALRTSEERHRRMIEQSPLPILENDFTEMQALLDRLRAEGVTDLARHLAEHPEIMLHQSARRARTYRLNEAALRLFGAETQAEFEAGADRCFTPSSAAAQRESFLAAWEGRMTIDGECIVRRLDGTERAVRFFSRALADELTPTRIHSSQTILIDITEQRAAEHRVRESEERYRMLFETTPNPMYIFDVETLRILAANTAAITRYGYSRQEFEQLSVLDLRPPDEAARLRRALEAQQMHKAPPSSGSHAAGLWRHRCKDGTILIVEVFTHSLVFNGRPCVLALPFDITAKLAAERALRDSEARYRELFENAVGGVYRSNPEGRFISVNPAMARLYGFENPKEMLEWNAREHGGAAFVQAEEHRQFLELIERHGKVENHESRLIDRHGNTLWVAETSRAVRDTDGRLLYYEGFVTDITARRRLETELLRSSKLEAVGILAGGIAHDFNNILTVVLGNVTLAEMDSATDSSVRRMLHDAKRATLRARDLTQQLLTFAKGGDPVRAAVALPDLLKESAEFAMHGAKSRCEFDLDPDLWPANADKGQLGQVVQNLVINAVQAMPQGGVVRIAAGNCAVPAGTVGNLATGDYVKISVSDTGTGIAPEHLTKIFDPYFTTKQQGSGLGLATVYSIARKHGGHIEVESKLGAGTTFHLWLPAAAQAAKPAQTESVSAEELCVRVLFMDDEEPIREMADLFLSRLGSQVTTAADGASAVEAYRAAMTTDHPFDVVVMDLTVPGGMGGREAMQHLLKLDPKVCAIVSSGYSRDPVLGSYRVHGFCGILPKPYGLDQLRKVIVEVLKGRNGSGAAF